VNCPARSREWPPFALASGDCPPSSQCGSIPTRDTFRQRAASDPTSGSRSAGRYRSPPGTTCRPNAPSQFGLHLLVCHSMVLALVCHGSSSSNLACACVPPKRNATYGNSLTFQIALVCTQLRRMQASYRIAIGQGLRAPVTFKIRSPCGDGSDVSPCRS
jgi:hypothetical protein